jgi:hypothetical protein
MYPDKCSTCGEVLHSKTGKTRHHGVCRGKLAALLAQVVEMPLGVALLSRDETIKLSRANDTYTIAESVTDGTTVRSESKTALKAAHVWLTHIFNDANDWETDAFAARCGLTPKIVK